MIKEGGKRTRAEESGEDYSSPGDQAEEASGESSESESESSELDDAANASTSNENEKEASHKKVRLQVMNYPFSQEVLKDDDVEMWLVRVPRYDAFVTGLSGREIEIVERKDGEETTKDGEITGRLKGYYGFRDYGSVDANERAAFVVKDSLGREKLEIAKPFSRSVRVTFDAPLTNRGDSGPPPRPYPNALDGLKLRYRPIGSGTASTLRLANGPMPVNSPLRKRKQPNSSARDGEEPSTKVNRQLQRENPHGKGTTEDANLGQRNSPRRKRLDTRHLAKVEPT